ncbi:MAG: protein phosphatase 2C domain-containing protein [Sandaracinaceae bacterium]
MQSKSAASSDTGRVRDQNEDAHLANDDLGFYVVCDGMGGHVGGEIASKMAVDICERVVSSHAKLLEDVREGLVPEDRLLGIARESIEAACAEIFKAAMEGKPEHRGMGCTMTLVILGARRAAMAHVGDTRLYLVRNARTHLLSTDHTMAAALAQMGTLSWDAVPGHTLSHTLLRAVGIQPTVQVDTLLFDIADGDKLVLCSDGLTEYIDDPQELSDEIETDEVAEAASSLVELALEAGGGDNVTAMVVRLGGAKPGSPKPDRKHELDVMRQSYLFHGTTFATRTRILGHCEVERYAAGDTAVGEGASCDVMPLVVEGALGVEGTDCTFGPGDLVGETMLLKERPARAKLTALTDARVIALSHRQWLRLSRRHPWLGVRLLERIATRMSERWMTGEQPAI